MVPKPGFQAIGKEVVPMARPADPTPIPAMALNSYQKAAFSSACSLIDNCIITGPSQSGKTILMSAIADEFEGKGMKVIRCAPTRLLADNLGKDASTIHHALGLPIELAGPDGLPSVQPDKIQGLQVLIIDCIHRCSALLVDIIWNAYEKAREEGHPFRVIASADFFQLAPFAPKQGLSGLEDYPGRLPKFPFQAAHWDGFAFRHVCLPLPFKPSDPAFSKALCRLRIGDRGALKTVKRLTASTPIDDAVWVFSRKEQAAKKNNEMIGLLETKVYEIKSLETGVVPEDRLGVPQRLQAAIGMKVIFTISDPKGRFFNGEMGYIRDISLDSGTGDLKIYASLNGKKGHIRVDRHTWMVQDPSGGLTGTISQYPFLPGYAVTLHRIYGARLPAMNMDPSCWDHGQLYSFFTLVMDLDPSRVHICGSLLASDLKVDHAVQKWEELEFMDLLDTDAMHKELSEQMKVVPLFTIPNTGRRNGLRYGAYTYQLDFNGQRIDRTFIVLRDERSNIMGVTDLHRYFYSGGDGRAARDIGHKAYFIVQFLNFVFIDEGDISTLEQVTIEHVRSFVHAYGYNTYGGGSHTKETFHDCVSCLLRFLVSLIQDPQRDMVLGMDDLFVRRQIVPDRIVLKQVVG